MGIDLASVAPYDRDRVWEFHSRPGALHRLWPPFMPLRPVREAASLADGIAELLPVAPLPGPLGRRLGPTWVAEHRPDGYVEGERFVDACVSEPYRTLTGWRHEHTFADAPGGTEVRDRVRARVPGRLLRPGFDYRHRQLVAELAAADRLPRSEPLTVAVSGASGLVGTQLVAMLGTCGHRVVRLVRGGGDAPDARRWDPEDPAPSLLDDVDVLVHLAGAPVAGRFTRAHLAAVRDSRVGPTRRLAELVAARGGATTMVCASAIGYYGGERGDESLTEDSPPGDGELAAIVTEWEAACEPARRAGVRVVSVRTGIALSAAGGVLGAMLPLYAAGLGGRLGDGRQWFSWILLDDLLDVYHRAVVDPTLSGPVNAVSPGVVRNSGFTRDLGEVLHRPTVLPVPAAAPRLVLGRDGARELALADQRVVPAALLRAGHVFRRPELTEALGHELGRPADDAVTGAASDPATGC